MRLHNIKHKVLSFGPWEPWIERPFGAFVLSFSKTFTHPHAFKKFGIDAGFNAMLYQKKNWYRSPNWDNNLQKKIVNYIKSGSSIFDISAQCQSFYKKSKIEIAKINSSKTLNPIAKLKKLSDIFYTAMDYVWITHSFETVYLKLFRHMAKKYVQGDIEKFISEVSFPVKKNAHALMTDELASGHSLSKIAKKYGWIKSRFKFIPGYTTAELKKMRQEMVRKKNLKPVIYFIKIPRRLKKLVDEMRELVYFRTYRTDVLYELLYLSRPSLKEIARHFNIKFRNLENYTIDDLLAQKPEYYPLDVSAVFYGGDYAIFSDPVFRDKIKLLKSVQGKIAFTGRVKGKAKVVKSVKDLSKVKAGDVLIAPMTVPSYLPAMHRAAAFVTDEGGLTCHAAIVAREMRKPCVIGTRVATKVFKDGDMVEVDANQGIVKKLN